MQELEKILQDDKFWDILLEEACVEGKQAERIEQRMREEIIEKDGWIPVDDRDHMPDAGEHVLVSIGTGFNPEKAFLSEDGRWMMLHAPDGYNDITDEVEAWMPMPKPYHSESVRLRSERNTF